MAVPRLIGRLRVIIPLFLLAAIATCECGCAPQTGPGSAVWREQARTYVLKEASIASRVQEQNNAVSNYLLGLPNVTATQTAAFVSAPGTLQALHDELAVLTPPDELANARASALRAIVLYRDSARAAVWTGSVGAVGHATVDESIQLGQDANREMEASTSALGVFISKYGDQLK